MIELRDVSYRYPGYSRHAIESLELALGDGEIVGLVGANEAGKSTLCLVASGARTCGGGWGAQAARSSSMAPQSGACDHTS